MELYIDGTFVWNGRAHVSVVGKRTGRSMIAAYRQALQLISEANIDGFRDKYEGGADCATWTTDQQTVAISVRTASIEKTINHYLGCQGFSRENDLLQLEVGLENAMRIRDFVR